MMIDEMIAQAHEMIAQAHGYGCTKCGKPWGWNGKLCACLAAPITQYDVIDNPIERLALEFWERCAIAAMPKCESPDSVKWWADQLLAEWRTRFAKESA